MYQLIATPFLSDYLVLKPGSELGIRLPAGHFEELRAAAVADEPVPMWLVDATRQQWGLGLRDEPINCSVLVRDKSPFGFCRATWEINLGCNFDCEHCYLGDRPFAGLQLVDKLRVITMLRDAGAVWLQITGGEPLIDPDFIDAYSHAFDMGMMIQISTNASTLHKPKNLNLLTERPPYRVTVSVYGASEASFDKLVNHKGAFTKFRKGVTAGLEAGLSMNLNLVITKTNGDEIEGMMALANSWGLPFTIYSNISPTFTGGNKTLLAQSMAHLASRRPFQGCNAGLTFFHVDPHGNASTCKIAREDAIPLIEEGVVGLSRLGAVSDQLLQRGGGCTSCQIQGTCGTCMPLVRRYREAKAPMERYCQHRETGEVIINDTCTPTATEQFGGCGANLSAACTAD